MEPVEIRTPVPPQRRQRRWMALGQVAQTLAQEHSLARVADVTVEQARRVLGADLLALWLVEHPRHQLELVADRGLPAALVTEFATVPLSSSLAAAQAAVRERPVEVREAKASGPELAHTLDCLRKAGVANAITLPLSFRGHVHGVMTVGYAPRRKFTMQDRRLMQVFADLCAAAIATARAFEHEQQARRAAEAASARLAASEREYRALAAEHQRLYLEAQDAVRTRDAVLVGVAHDLRSPLTLVRGHAQLLQRLLSELPAPLADRIGRSASMIVAATVNMAAQVNELLDVTRLAAGKALELQRAPTDLVALVQRTVDSYQRARQPPRIFLQSALPELTGEWDDERLQRMVANLLSNALKYSLDEGEIRVEVMREDTSAVLTVHDRGIGIPASDLPRIFDRFHRGRNVAGRIEGLGLGLTSVKAIVESHGGSITVHSEEAQGSTFVVRLPLAGA